MPKTVEKQVSIDHNCISALTQAEKNAKSVLEQARKRRAALLKKIKDDSTAETEAYKRACEDHMNRLQKDYNSGQDLTLNKFNKETSDRHAEMRRQYEQTYRAVLQSILEITIKPLPKFHENLKY